MSGRRRPLCAEDRVSGGSPGPSAEVRARRLPGRPSRMSRRVRREITTQRTRTSPSPQLPLLPGPPTQRMGPSCSPWPSPESGGHPDSSSVRP